MTLVKRGKNYEKAVDNAYNMLVTFRKIVENHPELQTYTTEEIEETYKQLFCEALPSQKSPWR